jgi:hypothetical protein
MYSKEFFGNNSDTDVVIPVDPTNGDPYPLRAVSFCYNYEVSISKTAHAFFDRTHTWTILKTADKTGLLLDILQTSPVNYQVSVNYS